MHTVVYIYGFPGCGKTKLLTEVFGRNWGSLYRGNLKLLLLDGEYENYTPEECNGFDYVIISSNQYPNMDGMDHVFYLYNAETVNECRSFLQSIYGTTTNQETI